MVRSAVTPHFAVRRVISRHLLGKIKLLESELIPNSWVSQTQVHLETTGPNTKELCLNVSRTNVESSAGLETMNLEIHRT